MFSCLKHVLHVFLSKKCLPVNHANIVQRVKTCYKIKIDYRVFGLLFLRYSAVQIASELNDKASFTL